MNHDASIAHCVASAGRRGDCAIVLCETMLEAKQEVGRADVLIGICRVQLMCTLWD